MRDIFEEIFTNQLLDPTEAARRGMRPQLRRRFYDKAETGTAEEGYRILLDGRPVKTPAQRILAAPSHQLAVAIAAEWDAQADVIDPARMPLTRLANTIIDGVAANADEIAAEIEKYLRSDLVCYRADNPEILVARQAQAWDPILAFAREKLDAYFVLTQGVRFAGQSDRAVAAAATAIPRDPWRLGAVHALTTLTGSALIALAVAEDEISVEAAWAAAHVDEDWNMEQWGCDELALARRAARAAEMQSAATVLAFVP